MPKTASFLPLDTVLTEEKPTFIQKEDCPVHGSIQVVFGNRDEHNMIEEDIHMAYITNAMSEAVYEKIGDNEYAGKIPSCWGVISFAPTLEECKEELLSVLEDWILVGLRFGHPLPAVGDIDMNKELLSKDLIHDMGTM